MSTKQPENIKWDTPIKLNSYYIKPCSLPFPCRTQPISSCVWTQASVHTSHQLSPNIFIVLAAESFLLTLILPEHHRGDKCRQVAGYCWTHRSTPQPSPDLPLELHTVGSGGEETFSSLGLSWWPPWSGDSALLWNLNLWYNLKVFIDQINSTSSKLRVSNIFTQMFTTCSQTC